MPVPVACMQTRTHTSMKLGNKDPTGPGSPATCLGPFPHSGSDTGEGPPSWPLPAPPNSKMYPGLHECLPTQTQQRAGEAQAYGPSPRLCGLPGHWPQGTGPGPAKTALCPLLAFLITERSGPPQSAINAVKAKSTRRGEARRLHFPP